MHRIGISVLVLALGALPGSAQDDAPVFRSDTRLVVVHASIDDGNGNLITDLPRSAFHIFENGIEQQIKVFRREDVPVSLGLVVDGSASMLEKRERVKSASLAMIKASHPGDEVFLVNYNEVPYLDTDFTKDLKKLEVGLSRWDSRGSTAMRDALRLSIEHAQRAGHEDKKVLLVVSDGEDNSSQTALPQLVRAAQQANVLIYAIGLLSDADTAEKVRARRDLDALTTATGGQAFYLKDLSEVDGITREIARVIRNQYTLAYTPTNEKLDGTFRKIQVVVDDERPLVVRSRSGYYAGREAPLEAGGRRPRSE